MSRTNISNLKAHLTEYLRQVRAGEEVVVLDRDRAIARIVAWTEGARPVLTVTPARVPFVGLRALYQKPVRQKPVRSGHAPWPKVDSLRLLLADRRTRR